MNQGRILALRKKLGWKQKEMADALGISKFHTISHWETGFRTPSGASERLLLLLEKLRGKDFHRVAKCLQKIGRDQIQSKIKKQEDTTVENTDVIRQKEIAQASFSADSGANDSILFNAGGKR